MKKILIACEYSGIVRDAFKEKGFDAWSCDLLPTDTPGQHYIGDVLDILEEGWDMMIGHPPCTYLCNSGVSWLYDKEGHRNVKRWEDMYAATDFFQTLLEANIPKICLENPIPHRYGIGKTYSQIIHPYQHGHLERKATCLWLKGLPKLEVSNDVKEDMLKLPKKLQQRLHHLPPSPDRWKLRSTTYKGIAQAMADQWSKYV